MSFRDYFSHIFLVCLDYESRPEIFWFKSIPVTSFFVSLIGPQRYSDVEYSGVLNVNTDKGTDYVGMVFGYQANQRFYVVMWRNENMNFDNTTYKAGTRGIQIKVSTFAKLLIFCYFLIFC